MANNIALEKVYNNIINEVYKKSALTAVLESDDNANNGGKGGEGEKPAGGLPHGGSGGDNTAALRAAFGITDKK